MKIGMLWYDNSNTSLSEKVGKAIAYYQDKYGRKPTLVVVHPEDYLEIEGIKVQSSRSVMHNHLWIGID